VTTSKFKKAGAGYLSFYKIEDEYAEATYDIK
jgi:hypothetical protein